MFSFHCNPKLGYVTNQTFAVPRPERQYKIRYVSVTNFGIESAVENNNKF